MNQTIKKRIEDIKNRIVPEGYKKTKAGLMPAEWVKDKTYKAKDVFYSVTNKKHNGQFEVLSATQNRGVIPRSQVDIDIKYNEESVGGYKKVDKGDFVISLRSFQGGIEYSEYEGLVSPAYTVLKNKLPISNGFYKAYFKTNDYINRLNKGTYGIRDGKQVGFEDFGDMVVHYPPVTEQEKIAEILETQDKVIRLKEKLIEQKKQQKKHLIQQLLTGKKRLPGFTDEWIEYPISRFLEIRNERQLPTVEAPLKAFVAEKGIVEKGSRYDRSFLVKSDDKEYKRTELWDFIYSSNNLDVGSIGLNTYGSAVISIVYEIFKVKSTTLPILISEIIQLTENMQKILKYRQGALYGQYKIYAEDFLSVKILMPELNEQQAIADILLQADKEIELLQKDLEEEKNKKKAVMQLLLTGIVRLC